MTFTEGKWKAYLCSRGEQGSIVLGTGSHLYLKEIINPYVQATTSSSLSRNTHSTWKRNGIEQGYTETDDLWYCCIYPCSIHETSAVSHQENSHLKEFTIRIVKRPKISKKKLGSKVDIKIIKEACCRSKLWVQSQSGAFQARPLYLFITQPAKHRATHQASHTTSCPEVNNAIHQCKVKLELKYRDLCL